MRFLRGGAYICVKRYTVVHCDYGALHNSCFCGVLVACFACSSTRQDSVSLNFAMHIELSIISLRPVLAFATRTQLQ